MKETIKGILGLAKDLVWDKNKDKLSSKRVAGNAIIGIALTSMAIAMTPLNVIVLGIGAVVLAVTSLEEVKAKK